MKKSPVMILITFLLAGFLTSCGNDQRFQRFDDYEAPPLVTLNYPIKSIERTNTQVDILWVIDNSYSMDDIQQNVISNTRIFMEEFDKKGGIDWKMALLSTDKDDPPYLGMNTRSGFNHRSANRVSTFVNAVSRLGLNGDTTERTFTPIMNNLSTRNVFVRENAMLVIISLTDINEQSRVTADQFIQYLTKLKGGIEKTKFYGVYNVKDFNCPSESTSWTYAGSKYEALVKATGGSTFPACAVDFGQRLTGLAKEIISYLQSSKIILKKRPKPYSISISYKGRNLPGGPQSEGGMWYYDFQDNAIVFYSLDFAPGTEENILLTFDEDDGF